MRRTTLAALCLATVTAAGLTGCGSGQDGGGTGRAQTTDPVSAAPAASTSPTDRSASAELFPGLTGGEIAERAVEATAAAESLRMKGDIPDETSGGTIRLDMAVDRKGDCAGTFGFDGQGEAELIKTGGSLYLRYDEAFLRAQSEGEPQEDVDATVALLAGQWTRTSATDADGTDIGAFCDLDTVLAGAGGVRSDATRGETTTVDGTPAIVLREKDGADTYTLYVATEGEPYLLRVDSAAANDPGSVVFSDFDEPVPADEPSGEVIDVDELTG
ncbi:hypothetical protein ACFXAZ_08825 [Streptomyces sp. NPDC059477]|uniref:hypothetical protein n=1 Tax=Streptomyces sp. NPDC059477 TaxID=3346847 RepID=UPI003689D861